jgi:hypothetical protein
MQTLRDLGIEQQSFEEVFYWQHYRIGLGTLENIFKDLYNILQMISGEINA